MENFVAHVWSDSAFYNLRPTLLEFCSNVKVFLFGSKYPNWQLMEHKRCILCYHKNSLLVNKILKNTHFVVFHFPSPIKTYIVSSDKTAVDVGHVM